MKKPSLAVLIGMGKPSSHDDGDSMSDEHDDEDQAYADAGDEAIAAMKKGDGKAFAEAVCALFDLHMASKDDKSKDEEGDEDSKGY